MNILVIGNSVEDNIIYRGINQKVKPGGIFYSTAAFSAFQKEDDTIYLISALEEKSYFLFEFIYKNINTELIQWIDAIPSIHLNVFDNKERHEKYENITNCLSINIADFTKYSGIYINMITGFDISLDSAKFIRNRFKGLTFIDIHSLARGMDDNYVREFRKIENFNDWAACFDIIQANENEILTFSDLNNEEEIAEFTLSLGPRFLIITKGEKGVTTYFNENNKLKSYHIEALPIETKNRIGCGDIFGATFFYHYLETNNLNVSINKANIAAGLIASYDNLNQLKNIKNDLLEYE